MTLVGTVTGLWRYPVKSMQGLAVADIEVGASQVVGDRHWGVIDAETGRLCSAKRFSELLTVRADDEKVTLPDGRTHALGTTEADDGLSELLGKRVALREPAPDTAVTYELTFEPDNDEAELVELPTPPGTFLDFAALHLVSTASLRAGETARPDLDWDVRRFRPNVVVEGDMDPFTEDDWVGRRVTIGRATLDARMRTPRCAMPLRAQPGLDRQPGLYRALEDLHANHLGVYLDVVEPGVIAIGDPVALS